jgi:hypothetical protein
MPHNSYDHAIDVWVARCLRGGYQAVLCETLPAELLLLLEGAPALSRQARDTEQ